MKQDPTLKASGNRQLESFAQTAIERQSGRTLDDESWQRLRCRLIEFVRMLQRWDVRRRTASSEKKKEQCRKVKLPAA
jgi:hypothetical protein